MDIVGIGHPCIDMLSVIERLPTSNTGASILDFSRQGGGIVPTAMVAAARLGASVGFIGLSGTCVNGRAIRDDFTYNGVDISRSKTIDGAYSDFSIVLSDLETKGRSIIYRRGDVRELELGDLDAAYITSADFLHLAKYDEVHEAAAVAMHKAGKRVTYDASFYSADIEAFLPHIDIFIASEFYYEEAFGKYELDSAQALARIEQCCKSVASKGSEIVVFTLGSNGCAAYSKNEGFFYAKSFDVNVVDTLGAGDVFHGAFLYGLSRGWGIRETALFSNAVAAVKICFIGGRAGIPSYKTVHNFMKTGEIDDAEIAERVKYYRDRWLFGR